MRNLNQYPITIKEIVACLDDLAWQLLKEKGVGDMRPTLLIEASQIVTRAGFAVSGVKQPRAK